MRCLIVPALAIGIWSQPVPQGLGQPEKCVAQTDRPAKAEDAAKTKKPQNPPTNKAALTPPAGNQNEGANQQQSDQELKTAEDQKNQEIAIERKLVTYTKWLVVVGAIQFAALVGQAVVFFFTLRTISHQTKLQGIALRQWVDIEKWRATPSWKEDGTIMLNVQFHVINPTNLPFTLIAVLTEIGDQRNGINRKNLIPPKKGYPVVTPIKITEEQRLKWEQDKIPFPVSIIARYEDVLEKVRDQPFNGWIMCSQTNGVIFIPPYGGGQYIAEADIDN